MTKLVTTLCVSVVAAFGMTGTAAAQVPGNQAGNSLVNVQVGDVTVLVPVSVAAALCDVNVNVLAAQLDTGDAMCEATAESIATPGNGGGNGGGNKAGNSLVNVQIGDITAKIPIAVAAALCDVNVNILARQLRLGDAACKAVATSEA